MSEALIRTADLESPYELEDRELDAVAAGGSLVSVTGNNVEVGAQVQVLTNQSSQNQRV
jgi:hypothetical protein